MAEPAKELKKARNVQITTEYLSGDPYRTIAENHNLSPQHISRIINKDENCRSIIDQATRLLISKLPKTIDIYTDLLQSDSESIKLSAARDIHKITGIASDRTAPSVQAFIQINQASGVDPDIRAAFSQHFSPVTSEVDTIDAEYTEE